MGKGSWREPRGWNTKGTPFSTRMEASTLQWSTTLKGLCSNRGENLHPSLWTFHRGNLDSPAELLRAQERSRDESSAQLLFTFEATTLCPDIKPLFSLFVVIQNLWVYLRNGNCVSQRKKLYQLQYTTIICCYIAIICYLIGKKL